MSEPFNRHVRLDFARKAIHLATRADLLFNGDEATSSPRDDRLFSEAAHCRQLAITYAVLATASSLDE